MKRPGQIMSYEECHKDNDAGGKTEASMKSAGQSVSGLGMMTGLTS